MGEVAAKWHAVGLIHYDNSIDNPNRLPSKPFHEEHDQHVLLALHKTGPNQGLYGGFSKEFFSENALEVYRRDGIGALDTPGVKKTLEENLRNIGLDLHSFHYAGTMLLHSPKEWHFQTIYRIYSYNGTPKETEHIKPAWFPVAEIPTNLCEPEKLWLEKVVKQQEFFGKALVARDSERELLTDVEFSKTYLYDPFPVKKLPPFSSGGGDSKQTTTGTGTQADAASAGKG
jgi:hypothetical protein